MACDFNVNTEKRNKPVKSNPQKNINALIEQISFKNLPIIDSTNFDNIVKVKEFTKEEIKLLQLNKIYPDIDKKNNKLKFQPSYKINLGDFNSVVINVFKGEHELESILIIYDSYYKLSQYYNQEDKLTSNSLTISYDEIAEGWSRKFSKIENNTVTIVDEFYGDYKHTDTTKFHINRNGDINQIKTKFTSKLRPDKTILLNHIYTDSIQFKEYNYDGDFPNLKGEKDGKEVFLDINMDWYNNDKYNFNYGDFIKVKWKMDSIWIEGDGGTLDFSERLIDAEKIQEAQNTKYILALKDYLIKKLKKENDLEIEKYTFENNVLTIQGNEGFDLSSYDFNDMKIYNNEKSKNITIYNIGGGAGGNVIVSETYALTAIDSINFSIKNIKTELLD